MSSKSPYFGMLSASLLLLLCQQICASDQTVLQVSTLQQVSRITAHGNTLVLGYPPYVSSAEATGAVHISYYDENTRDYNLLSSGGLCETKLYNPFKTGVFGNSRTDANGNAGFGESLAMSSDTELFISAASSSSNTGRVYSYRGRNSQWSVMQVLAPHSKSRREIFTNIDSFFGGAIAATPSELLVGCQNCNSSEAAPPSTSSSLRSSGEVYVYRPNPSRTFWSASQILTAENVKFLGEHVAAHADIVVATGDAVKHSAAQYITDKPTQVVVFQRGRGGPEGVGGSYSQLQVLTVPNAATYTVSEVVVYDETIVLSASTYTNPYNPNQIYVYYPSTARYGHTASGGGGAKAKPRPVQWSLHQTLARLGLTVAINFHLQIRGNNLVYSSFHTTKDQVVLYRRSALGGIWTHSATSEVDLFEIAVGTSDLYAVLTPQQKLFFVNLASAGTMFQPIDLNPASFHCLQIYVGDHFGDGWGSAMLTVESPLGLKDSFSPRCDSYNPITTRYCPRSSDDQGVYKLRVEHNKEDSFPWEIVWKVFDERSGEWYFGTHETEMDFEWSVQFTDFTARQMERLHDKNDECHLCASSPRQPADRAGKPRPSESTKHLRSLHGKSVSASPTVSPAPTIDVTGLEEGQSLYFKMGNGGNDVTSWYSNANSGSMYFISDVGGRKLFSSGTACVSGVNEVSCWVDLPDGDYLARVGGALDASMDRQWKFCGGIHYQAKQTELYFSVRYGVCVPAMSRSYANVCNNVLKVTTLHMEIVLTGDFSSSTDSLASESHQEIASFINSFLYKQIGEVAKSIDVRTVSIRGSTAVVGVLVGLNNLNSNEVAVALVDVLGDSSHDQASRAKTLLNVGGVFGIETMALAAVRFYDEVDDVKLVDESSFRLVNNYVLADVAGDDDTISGSHTLEKCRKFVRVVMNSPMNVIMTVAVLMFVLLLTSLAGKRMKKNSDVVAEKEESEMVDSLFRQKRSCPETDSTSSAASKCGPVLMG